MRDFKEKLRAWKFKNGLGFRRALDAANKVLKKHEHEYKMKEIRPVSDWRVPRNLHHEIWACEECGHRQWRSGYYDENGNPQDPIAPLEGECELSER
jgi:ribosomal protein L37AE/L43A